MLMLCGLSIIKTLRTLSESATFSLYFDNSAFCIFVTLMINCLNCRAGSATSMADAQTIEHAVTVYNALVAVIRDVVLKAKLTPVGGTEGVSHIGM